MSWLCKVAGHSFEARYDSVPRSRGFSAERLSSSDLKRILDSQQERTYRCDVCTRCGIVVNRQEGK